MRCSAQRRHEAFTRVFDALRRGAVHRLGAVPVVVTHELPFLLRQPDAKAQAWDDLCLAREAAQAGSPPAAH